MIPQRWRPGICWFVAIGLITGGCAGAPAAKPTRHSSLGSTLASVDTGGSTERPPDPEKGARFFLQAMQQLSRGNDAQALQLFEQSVDADPTQPAAFNNLGILHKRIGEIDKAIEDYQRAIVLRDDYPEAHYNLGLAYRAAGQFRNAEQAYLKALNQNDQLRDAHYNLGILYDIYIGAPDKALAHYRAYLQLGGPRSEEVERWVTVVERLVPRSLLPPSGTGAGPNEAPPAPSGATSSQAVPASGISRVSRHEERGP